MAKHLAQKVARLIGDFRTIDVLVQLIEHEMEKRIVARHALVKLDALLLLLPQLKNEIRLAHFGGRKKSVEELTRRIERLRHDYEGSVMQATRDALAAHSLRLDLAHVVESWTFLGKSAFGVLLSDLNEIDAELAALEPTYVSVPGEMLDPRLPSKWRHPQRLGDPAQPRFAVIYPGLATAGIVSPIPTKSVIQENFIRAAGLATFLRQVRIMADDVAPGTTLDRLLAEVMLNDYLALWELLFTSNVQNEHGLTDLCVLDHWKNEKWKGEHGLKLLKAAPHPDLDRWRELRNKLTAHLDPDVDIAGGDVASWPMTVDVLIAEAGRVVETLGLSAAHDIRAKFIFTPPTPLRGVIGLTGQDGRRWDDS